MRRAAERFQVSPTTAARWAARYREFGQAGMADRSARPRRCPRRTPTRVERRIIKVRVVRRWGPARIGFLLGMHPSTVHRVLSRYRLARLAWLDRASGRAIRRYEHPTPGSLVHVDVKKLGRIPDGGGWRAHGRAAGARNARATTTTRRNNRRVIGYHYLHSALDDHSRLTYSELLPDETGDTAAGFWTRARAWFAGNGIAVQRVLSDNGSCYRSRAFAAALGPATHKRTRLPSPDQREDRTIHRKLADEWAYARSYASDSERCDAYPAWLHHYNHHRGHTALGGQPPASRVPNLSGQYT